MSATMPVRRFNVEPVETSFKSSKDIPKEPKENITPRRRFAAEPIETTSKTRRKFDNESFEYTRKSSRKFTPEPVETTVRSNRAQHKAHDTPRRFKPEPIETTMASNRNRTQFLPEIVEPKMSKNKPARKFAPQLIETAKRSRKAGDTTPAVLASDKTEATPGQSRASPRKSHIRRAPGAPENTPICEASQNPFFLEMKRAASPLSVTRRGSRGSLRSHHSFTVPKLDPIESSESEESSPPSLSTTPSATSDTFHTYKDSTRMRESVDDRYSGYLLELAAREAEKQLREQAMAAFPNNDYHEPVDHFVDRDSDWPETNDPGAQNKDTGRRGANFTEVNWELIAMQKHREKLEKLEKQQEVERQKKKKEDMMTKGGNGMRQYNPWGSPLDTFSSIRNNIPNSQKDPELEQMRKGARPPMLGKDIKFPRCPSPEPARFDTTQSSESVRSAMCYLTQQSQHSEKGEGLWCGQQTPSTRPSMTSHQSNASSRTPSHGGGGGLWGGCCLETGTSLPKGPTGLMTPRVELDNHFAATPAPTPARGQTQLPPTPPASTADITSIDEKLAVELTIEEEFGDNFITQVYNYLSLGYPSIARDFDDELSKISRIPISELRRDDHLAQSRGYIRLGADGNLQDTDITEEDCMRWRALRSYVQEWARQQPKMVAGDTIMGGIGVAVRRGSWAW